MALNQEEYQSLKNVSLLSLYEKDKDYWIEIVRKARKYTVSYLPKSTRVRPDDVVIALIPAIRLNETFATYCHSKKLVQQYWCKWFSDLIIDEYFYKGKRKEDKKK